MLREILLTSSVNIIETTKLRKSMHIDYLSLRSHMLEFKPIMLKMVIPLLKVLPHYLISLKQNTRHYLVEGYQQLLKSILNTLIHLHYKIRKVLLKM